MWKKRTKKKKQNPHTAFQKSKEKTTYIFSVVVAFNSDFKK